MKKVVRIILVVAAFVLTLSACTQHLCPAYTNNDSGTETEEVKG